MLQRFRAAQQLLTGRKTHRVELRVKYSSTLVFSLETKRPSHPRGPAAWGYPEGMLSLDVVNRSDRQEHEGYIFANDPYK